jgi:hypothetical protein
MAKGPNKVAEVANSVRKGPSYPYYPWMSAVKIADAVKSLGGDRQPVPKGDIAHQLEMAEESQSLAQNIASARVYGIIEGHGEYKLTEAGRSYYYPEDASEKRRAELAMLNTPAVHAALIKRFDGNVLPLSRNLGTILLGLGVPVSWVDRVGSQFKEACERMELIDPGGHLRYGFAARFAAKANGAEGSVKPEGEGDAEHDEVKPPPPPPKQPPAENQRDNVPRGDTTVWAAPTPNGTVRVETPVRLTREAWVKLTRYVEILEPPQEEG